MARPATTPSRPEREVVTTAAGSTARSTAGKGREPSTLSTAILSGSGLSSASGLASKPTRNNTAM